MLSHLSPLPLLLFSLCRPGVPRELHSFPTRRSSDLQGSRLAHADEPQRDEPLVADHGRESAGGDQEHENRKSTRLNSSHVAISYAVFCLKKKRKNGRLGEVWSKTTEVRGRSQYAFVR